MPYLFVCQYPAVVELNQCEKWRQSRPRVFGLEKLPKPSRDNIDRVNTDLPTPISYLLCLPSLSLLPLLKLPSPLPQTFFPRTNPNAANPPSCWESLFTLSSLRSSSHKKRTRKGKAQKTETRITVGGYCSFY